MMGSNLNESLLAGSSPPASSSPSRTAASGSDDDIKTDRTPPRLPPPSPSLPADMAKNETSSSYSPSPPSVSNANVAKNLSSPPQSSPPSVGNANVAKNLSSPPQSSPHTASDSDERSSDSTKLPGGPDPSTSPSRPALGGPSTAIGLKEEDPTSARTSHQTSPSSFSSSPTATSRGWLGLRRRPQRLPVYAPAPPPPPGRSFNRFHQWKETNRPKAPRLDSVGVEKVIGIFGFSLFGSVSLLPSTMDRIKESKLPDAHKTILMMSFGLIWVVASAGVLYGRHGKTDLEQAVCRHTGRLGMFGLALLVILHVRWTLPAGIGYDIACYILVFVAGLVHIGSWIVSCIVGEDRMDDAAPGDAQH